MCRPGHDAFKCFRPGTNHLNSDQWNIRKKVCADHVNKNGRHWQMDRDRQGLQISPRKWLKGIWLLYILHHFYVIVLFLTEK